MNLPEQMACEAEAGQLQQPWGDERLKLNGVYIGCVTKQNADILMRQTELVECLYRFIDRMNDICPEDPAEKIIEEFTAAAMPLLDKYHDALFPKQADLAGIPELMRSNPSILRTSPSSHPTRGAQ